MTVYATVYTNPATGAGAASADVATFGAAFPAGVIVMWSGTIGTIPPGWKICDGTNGTPNLLAKFIKGVATAATNPGATGGAASVSYTPTGTIGAPSATIATGSSGAVKPTATHNHLFAGDAATIATEPAYFALAFIMKT